jgi:putative sugar O-methyltransferase
MDQFQSQLSHFIEHAPDFFKDGSIPAVDEKHQRIINSAYDLLNAGFTIDQLRNWAGQTDMGVHHRYTSLSGAAIGDTEGKTGAGRWMGSLGEKITARLQHLFGFSMMLDDISILEMVGGKKFLQENPQSATPGATPFPPVKGYSVTPRWIRYLYLLTQIHNRSLLKPGDVWVDVGSFYGGVQGLVKKYYPQSRIVLVDFHHQLLRSYVYLQTQFPESAHIMPSEIDQYTDLHQLPENAFLYVPVTSFDKIAGMKANLVSNFFSLGEMRREHFEQYMNSSLFRNADKMYLVNRFVSSPFFEKTYDTDINVRDYLAPGKEVSYFDIFPVNHYQIIRRKLFGRTFFRNTSSSYFELIYG